MVVGNGFLESKTTFHLPLANSMLPNPALATSSHTCISSRRLVTCLEYVSWRSEQCSQNSPSADSSIFSMGNGFGFACGSVRQ